MTHNPASNRRKIGVLISRPVQDHESETKEIGQFTLDVIVSNKMFLASGDKKGFAKSAIAMHLASALHDLQMPAEYFAFIPEVDIAKAFGWPDIMPMGVTR
jgi:hypothetical protein